MLSFDKYVLRPLEAGDSRSLATNANNLGVWKNLRDRFPHPYTEFDAISFIQQSTQLPLGRIFAICQDAQCIGTIGLEPGVDVHRRTAELGYWLGEPFWGRGIMSQAVIHYVEFARRQFDLVRVFAEPFSSNPGSARVLEKAGFILEGILKKNVVKDGKVLDSLLYAKTW